MNQFGTIALRAVELIHTQLEAFPDIAWKRAAAELAKSKSTLTKPCPRSAFLGLCEEGLVQGIEAGIYGRFGENKQYALEAVRILQKASAGSDLFIKPSRLWAEVKKNLNTKLDLSHNSQMNVVLALYHKGLIIFPDSHPA